MKKAKTIIPIISISFFVLVVTLIITFSITGYEIDVTNRTVIKNGIISIRSDPKDAEVIIDDKKVDGLTNTDIDIEVGAHRVVVSKPGYYKWSNVAVVEQSRVVNYDYLKLIPVDPEEDKLLVTTNVVGNYYDPEDNVIYFIGRDRSSSVGTFFTISIYSVSEEEYIVKPKPIGLTGGEVDFDDPQTELRVLDSSNGLLLLELSNSKESNIIAMDSRQPDTVSPVSSLYAGAENIESAEFLNSSSVLLSASGGYLVTVDDWSNSEPVITEIAEDAKLFHVSDDGRILVQYNDMTDVWMIQADTKPSSGVTLDGVKGDYNQIYLHEHGGQENIILGTKTGAKSYNFSELTSGITAVEPIWSTALTGTQFKSSGSGRFISLSNKDKIFTHDHDSGESSIVQLKDFIDPQSLKWTNDHYFTAMAENQKSILVSDYDGANQHSLVPTTQLDNLLGLDGLLQEIYFIDLNNSVWRYTL